MSSMGYLSSLFFALDPSRLTRTMQTISGGETPDALGTSMIIKDGRCCNRAITISALTLALGCSSVCHSKGIARPWQTTESTTTQ